MAGVRLGEWDQSNDQDCDDSYCSLPVVDVPVVDRIPHESYVPTSRAQENDIALLRLGQSVQFTDFVKPICLPVAQSTRNLNYDNYPFVVAGWGKVSGFWMLTPNFPEFRFLHDYIFFFFSFFQTEVTNWFYSLCFTINCGFFCWNFNLLIFLLFNFRQVNIIGNGNKIQCDFKYTGLDKFWFWFLTLDFFP